MTSGVKVIYLWSIPKQVLDAEIKWLSNAFSGFFLVPIVFKKIARFLQRSLTSEGDANSSVVWWKNPRYAQPDPITYAFGRLYLRDICASDYQLVFIGEWVYSSYFGHSRNWLSWGFTLAGSACRVRGVKIDP